MPDISSIAPLQPFDEHNRLLQSHVHPSDWKNPTPDGRYNLVVIGAGTAGLVAAAGAAGLGAKVALIERELMGGDCLNVGCVPSKALISAGRVAAVVRHAPEFGVQSVGTASVDFPAVMERMRRLRAEISPNDSVSRFSEKGVDIFLGAARFVSSNEIEVGETRLNFKRAVIATGARAAQLPIPGLADSGALTNETVFSLTLQPKRLGVIGGGPIGSEMAQTFAQLGSEVIQIEKESSILSREDRQAALIVQHAMEQDGVSMQLNAETIRIENRGAEKIATIIRDGVEEQVVVDELLVGVGRQPNVEDLGLDAVGVKYDSRTGVHVNDRLQTTNKMIYAAGDVCSQFKFTHAADFMARIVIQNALFKGRAKASSLVIPWCTYTTPELAHCGLTAEQADERGIGIRTFTQEFADVDRAILEGDKAGLVKIHVLQKSDRIVGATIVAKNAGDMIGEISLAMSNKIGLGRIASTIHPYPTQGEAIRKVGDLYNRTRLTPFVAALMKKWLNWTR